MTDRFGVATLAQARRSLAGSRDCFERFSGLVESVGAPLVEDLHAQATLCSIECAARASRARKPANVAEWSSLADGFDSMASQCSDMLADWPGAKLAPVAPADMVDASPELVSLTVVDAFGVDTVMVADGVAVSQAYAAERMKCSGYACHEYALSGGNGWITATVKGAPVVSVSASGAAPESAPAYRPPVAECERERPLPSLSDVSVAYGVAGRLVACVDVTYPGGAVCPVTFAGSVYGGPVVMILGSGQHFVSSPERFGRFCDGPADWVRRFYA